MKKKAGKAKAHEQTIMNLSTIREITREFPGIEEGLSYGTPAFKVGGKLLLRMHQDGESLVIRIDLFNREILLHAEPDIFYVTDHYESHPLMLARLSKLRPEMLRDLLEQAWRSQAPKRLVQALDKKA
jgi:hypothetical protein